MFVALPGDDKPDAELRDLSTCAADDYDALWSYLVEGGPQNATAFLSYANALVHGTDKPQAANPLLRAGVYWPQVVPIIFYRALVQGGGLNPINRLVKSLLRAGLQPMPIFVASLKDPLSVATLDQIFRAAPPAVILNCTAFARTTATTARKTL